MTDSVMLFVTSLSDTDVTTIVLIITCRQQVGCRAANAAAAAAAAGTAGSVPDSTVSGSLGPSVSGWPANLMTDVNLVKLSTISVLDLHQFY